MGAISREPLVRDCPPLQPADLERVEELMARDPIPLTELRRYVGSRAGLGTLPETRVDDATDADEPPCIRASDVEGDSAESEAVRRLRPLLWKVRLFTQPSRLGHHHHAQLPPGGVQGRRACPTSRVAHPWAPPAAARQLHLLT